MYQKFDLSCCKMCPRVCGVNRYEKRGRCRAGATAVVSRAALHFWEEPPLSGSGGSGAIFFSGCGLGCVYCQNAAISKRLFGRGTDAAGLAEIMRRLEGEGAQNIDFITATHFAHTVLDALEIYRPKVTVFNCGGYEKVETLKALSGAIDVWLPDFKYSDRKTAQLFSGAEDYPDVAAAAISEMLAQRPENIYKDANLVSGVIIRHLVLPGCIENTRGVLDVIKRRFGTDVTISLMNQYTPTDGQKPPLDRLLKPLEYKIAVAYARERGFENGFVQESGASDEAFIPLFTGEIL